MVHAHLCFLWVPVLLPVGRSRKEEKVGPFPGPCFENIRVVQRICPGRIKGDVGCDRMVFAINSDLCLMEFN